MFKKGFTLFAAAAVSISALTACTDNTKLKEEAIQSLAKQKEMNAYSFEGSATLALSEALAGSPNPLTNGILSLFRNSTIEWTGASSLEPLQFESDIKLTPKGSTSPISLPVLLKDNKLYFHMPAINKTDDEYYAIDLQQMSQASKSPLTPDSLKNTSAVTSELSSLFWSGTDPKWFNTAKDPVVLKDGTNAKSIAIDITSKNEKELNTLLQSKLPEFISTLQTNGMIDAEKAEKLKKQALSLQLHAPGKLAVAIDEQGFVRDQQIELQFTVAAEDGKAEENSFSLHQTYDAINQAPSFKKDIPANVKSFDEVLKLIGKTTK